MPCLFYFGLKVSQHCEARPFILASFSFLVHLGFLTQKGSRWIAVDLPRPSGGSLPNLSPYRAPPENAQFLSSRRFSSTPGGGSSCCSFSFSQSGHFPGLREGQPAKQMVQRAAGGGAASCPAPSRAPCTRSTLGRAGLGGRQPRKAAAGGFW